MEFDKNLVGTVVLAPEKPQWLINLAAAVANVDREEFLRETEALCTHVRDLDRNAAIKQARELVAEFGLLKADVFVSSKTIKPKTKNRDPAVTVKYRDPTTGNEWSGRGSTPTWLRGKDLTEYAVS